MKKSLQKSIFIQTHKNQKMHRILVIGKKQQMHWPENVFKFLPKNCEKKLFLYNCFSLQDTFYKFFFPHKRNLKRAQKLHKLIIDFQPDIILFVSAFFIPLSCYEVAHSFKNIKKIGWVADAFGEETYPKASLLDELFCTDTGYIQNNPHCPCRLKYLPLCADDTIFHNEHKAHTESPFFVGAGNKQRTNYLKAITTPCEIWGNNWEKEELKQHLVHNQKLSHQQTNMFYQTTRAPINMNFSPNIINGLNFRVFEIGCAGGLILINECPDIHLCYEVGKECLTYTTPESLNQLILQIIQNPQKYDKIAKAGYKRTLKDHTFTRRIEQLLKEI